MQSADIEAVIDRIIIREVKENAYEGMDQAKRWAMDSYSLTLGEKRLNLFTALHVYGWWHILCHTITEPFNSPYGPALLS